MTDFQFGRVRFVSGDNSGKYPFNHSLYLQGEAVRLVIDPACSLQKLSALCREGVDRILLSHWHEDHIRYLYLFNDCPVWMSKRDFPPLTDINIFMDWYGIEDNFQRAFWEKTMLEEFNFKPRQEARFVADDEKIELGGLSVEVIATPGHTPGHLSFFIPEEEILFLGDYDLTSFGPWYGDVDSSIEETIKSIRKLRSVPARRFVVAHNTGLYEENPGELWDNYENTIYERDKRLLNFLREPKKMDEIVAAWLIYGRPRQPKEFFEFNERVLITKHLEYLQQQGKILLENNLYIKI